jgi:death-on-curing protein
LADLAAAYAAGIIGNHPFIDGNKRTGFVAMLVFLGQNGIDFDVPEAEATVAILMLAAGEMAEDGLSRWIRDRMPNS